MKAKSTILKQIGRLRRLSANMDTSPSDSHDAYCAYHALRWVIEDVGWTPVSLIVPKEKPKEKKK